jgi:hypothetical protein
MLAIRRPSALALLALAVSVCATGQVNNPKNIDTAANPRGSDPAGSIGRSEISTAGLGSVHPELYQLWKGLPGRYTTGGDGDRLTVTLKATTPYVLFLEARTEAGGRETVERGWVHLGDASPSYTSTRMRFALAYEPESLRSEQHCTMFGSPGTDGITFATEGSDCSFVLGRRVGNLTVNARRDTITLSQEKDGETTVFARIPAK